MYRTRHRICVTADQGRAVAESDPEARFLLVPARGVVDDATAARLGLAAFEAALDAEGDPGDTDPVPPAEPDHVVEKPQAVRATTRRSHKKA